jgi:multidrug efflux pump
VFYVLLRGLAGNRPLKQHGEAPMATGLPGHAPAAGGYPLHPQPAAARSHDE